MIWSLEGTIPNIDVKDGDDLTVRLPGKRTVKGRAIDATGAPMTSLRMTRGQYYSQDIVSTDGTFELTYFEPQKYTLTFSSPRVATTVVRTVDLTWASADLGDIVFPKSTKLSGVVVDDATGLPIIGAFVKGSGLDLQTNTKGVFEIQIDPAKRLELDVTRPGFIAKFITVDAHQREVRIALTRWGDAGYQREFGGIGVSASPLRDGGAGFELLQVLDDGPAKEAGLRAGDEVLEIDGEPPVGSVEDVLLRVRGSVGTVVRLTIRREGRIFEVRVTRKLIRY